MRGLSETICRMDEQPKTRTIYAPDPGWVVIIEVSLEGIYKILLVVCIWHLAYNIAMGKVEEATSFGLKEVIRIAGLLAGGAQLYQYLGKRKEEK